ncbi:glycosyltransferase family 4 protein [Paenibacillus kobensis]|uniref:glycosyltransferase family 4 protein n=1 Tax=Paenibacillus kobensis TaxID=59841 RepID=UPI000FDC6048|nr:glycosyltransferase family 4 protein [Paenibacillus kobensis]
MTRLYIIHENGAPRHFEALYHMNNDTQMYDSIISLEFTFLRQFVKGITRRKPDLILRAIRNACLMVYLLFSRNKTVIVGAAPFDSFIYYLYFMKIGNEIIYYSSWPYWDLSKYPKKLRYWGQLRLWQKFLHNVQVVGVTEKVTEGLRQYTPYSTVIPHCINEVFAPDTIRENEPFRIIYVGRLIEEKGMKTILQLMSELQNDTRFEWWIVGDGPYRDTIQDRVNQYNNVQYFGQVKDQKKLANLYNQSHVLLLPSQTITIWEELFGIVIIEAMACGVIPISSDAIGPKTIIEQDSDGYLVKPDDINSMKEKLTQLADNRLKFQSMSSKAIEKAQQRYSITTTSRLWERVMSESLSKKHEMQNVDRMPMGG